MAEKSQVERSIEAIHRDLAVLRDSGAIRPEQFASIVAQLPAPGGPPSNYVDARFGGGNIVSPQLPQTIAQQAQDPNHPANPNHHQHAEWAKRLAQNFGNAMVFGGGATLGSDVVNSAWNAIVH